MDNEISEEELLLPDNNLLVCVNGYIFIYSDLKNSTCKTIDFAKKDVHGSP